MQQNLLDLPRRSSTALYINDHDRPVPPVLQAPYGSRHVFIALDGLRGVAAISVVLFHYCYGFGYPHQLLPRAFLAVDFFFVLSGFVLAHAYERRLLTGLPLQSFVQRRLIRLYPLFCLGLTIPMVLLTLDVLSKRPHTSWSLMAGSYALGVLLFPTPPLFSPTASVFPLNGPAWSLSLEIAMSTIYASACHWLASWRLFALALVAAAGLIATACYYNHLNLGSDWPTYLGGWGRVFWSFFGGVLTYRFYKAKRGRDFPLWVGPTLALLLIGIFAYSPKGPVFALLNVLVIFPLIVLIGAKVKMEGAAQRVASWLGATSYALYIVHVPVFQLLSRLYLFMHAGDPRAFPPNLLLWSAIALGTAWALDVVYDIPVRTFLSKRLAATSSVKNS